MVSKKNKNNYIYISPKQKAGIHKNKKQNCNNSSKDNALKGKKKCILVKYQQSRSDESLHLEVSVCPCNCMLFNFVT